MKLGVVLGAGGMVGLAYNAGALHALHEIGGVDVAGADLIVGTSAGSVVAAYLRSGWTTQDFWDLAHGRHQQMEGLAGPNGGADIFVPSFRNPIDLTRRLLGTTYVLTRSAFRFPAPRLPGWIQAAFPGGMFQMVEGQRRFAAELPSAWPSAPLWLCAVDLVSGRRVVLGRRGTSRATLQEAVLASCAIPGVYQPVRVGHRVLVDGGAHSSSNLDLAARFGSDVIIGVVPMAFDPASPPGPVGQLMRRVPARSLAAEVAYARRRGAEVLLVRPSAAEVRLHGIDMMRHEGLDAVAQAAYDSTARWLETPRFQSVLGQLAVA